MLGSISEKSEVLIVTGGGIQSFADFRTFCTVGFFALMIRCKYLLCAALRFLLNLCLQTCNFRKCVSIDDLVKSIFIVRKCQHD
jgi:hypothetical protein